MISWSEFPTATISFTGEGVSTGYHRGIGSRGCQGNRLRAADQARSKIDEKIALFVAPRTITSISRAPDERSSRLLVECRTGLPASTRLAIVVGICTPSTLENGLSTVLGGNGAMTEHAIPNGWSEIVGGSEEAAAFGARVD